MDSTTPASAPAYVTSVPGILVIVIDRCPINFSLGTRVKLYQAEEAAVRESVAP